MKPSSGMSTYEEAREERKTFKRRQTMELVWRPTVRHGQLSILVALGSILLTARRRGTPQPAIHINSSLLLTIVVHGGA
eukprot:6382582-Amphidinium_carterae.1